MPRHRKTQISPFSIIKLTILALIIGPGAGVGVPLMMTMILTPQMSEWTPLAVLGLMLLIVLWPVGLFWTGLVTAAYFVSMAKE